MLCATIAEVEQVYEKVALFANRVGFPTHAARQLPSGRWTSKLGALLDIEHALQDLAGVEYGSVVLVLKQLLPPAVGNRTEQQGS